MSAEITTIVAQLNIIEGQWHSNAPNQAAVREPKSAEMPGFGKGDLFVLVELPGDHPQLEQKLTELVRDTYYLARGSITASLRRALQAASDLLYQQNQNARSEDRLIGGAAVLVSRDKDAFVAQIGSPSLFAVLGDHIQRYPVSQEARLSGRQGLGSRAVIEPNLHHLRIGAEDILVLADSRLAGQLPLEKVVELVEGQNAKNALKSLGKLSQATRGSAMTIEVIEQTPVSFGPLKVNTPASLNRFLAGREEQSQPEPVKPPPPPAPAPVSAPAPAKTKIKPPPPRSYKEASPFYDKQSRPDRTMTAMASEPRLSRSTESPFSLGDFLRWVGAGLLMVAALLGSGLKAVLSLVLPQEQVETPRQAGMQANQLQPSSPGWGMLRNIALLLPFLVAVIVGVSYLQKGRIREAEYQEYITTAQNRIEQAQAVEPTAALGLLSEGEKLLIQAAEIKPDQPEITEMRQQIAEEVDRLGNVQRLYYLPQLRQYTDPGTQLEKIVVQGIEMYVLDVGADHIYHHQLDDTGETLLPDDDSLLLVSGEQMIEETPVGELWGMVWMPTGGNRQTSDLLVLSDNGLLEYNPHWGITTSPIAGQDLWGTPVALSSFFGNLYLLDPQANQIWRYLPTAEGYNGPPEPYLPQDQPADLSGAVDFAIDGAIYILFQDGRIEKYLSGQLVEFNLTNMDQPFNNPVSIFTAPDEEIQHIYVADAGNRRIVQLNKDGSFVRQFKPRVGEIVSFANLQDIFVDEIGGRMYILDSNNLYAANIPGE